MLYVLYSLGGVYFFIKVKQKDGFFKLYWFVVVTLITKYCRWLISWIF